MKPIRASVVERVIKDHARIYGRGARSKTLRKSPSPSIHHWVTHVGPAIHLGR